MLNWVPKTKIGIDVKAGKIKNIDEILSTNKKILEQEGISPRDFIIKEAINIKVKNKILIFIF